MESCERCHRNEHALATALKFIKTVLEHPTRATREYLRKNYPEVELALGELTQITGENTSTATDRSSELLLTETDLLADLTRESKLSQPQLLPMPNLPESMTRLLGITDRMLWSDHTVCLIDPQNSSNVTTLVETDGIIYNVCLVGNKMVIFYKDRPAEVYLGNTKELTLANTIKAVDSTSYSALSFGIEEYIDTTCEAPSNFLYSHNNTVYFVSSSLALIKLEIEQLARDHDEGRVETAGDGVVDVVGRDGRVTFLNSAGLIKDLDYPNRVISCSSSVYDVTAWSKLLALHNDSNIFLAAGMQAYQNVVYVLTDGKRTGQLGLKSKTYTVARDTYYYPVLKMSEVGPYHKNASFVVSLDAGGTVNLLLLSTAKELSISLVDTKSVNTSEATSNFFHSINSFNYDSRNQEIHIAAKKDIGIMHRIYLYIN